MFKLLEGIKEIKTKFKNMTIIKRLLFLCLLPMLSFAQSDEALIKKTITDYLDGGTNGQVDRFKSAFTSDAIQKSVSKSGSMIGMSVNELASKIKPGAVMDRTTRLVSWSYAGVAATAVTETVYANSKIIDLLNLVKVGNEWKIVSRVYSRLESDEEITSSGGEIAMKASSKKDDFSAPAKAAPKKKPVVDDGW